MTDTVAPRTSSHAVVPHSLKDAPALIETLLPVQKLSAEAYKEQMSGSNKTLTALGNYWKGRKPLILNKACILGCLLPTTDDPVRDLEIFETDEEIRELIGLPRKRRESEMKSSATVAPEAHVDTPAPPESAPAPASPVSEAVSRLQTPSA